MATIRITTAQNIDIDYEVASLGDRVLARLIDLGIFILIFVAGLIGSLLFAPLAGWTLAAIILVSLYAALFVFYDLLCEIFMNGQSIGKRIMKIKVISIDGGQPSVGQYLLRWLFRIVDFGFTNGLCALISVAVSEKQQRVGDMVAGTTLIKTQPRTHMENVAFIPETTDYEPVFKEAAGLSEQDVKLVQDVINTYIKTKNAYVVQNMAMRIRDHLNVSQPVDMNDMRFLQVVLKDYAHIVTQVETL